MFDNCLLYDIINNKKDGYRFIDNIYRGGYKYD